MFRFEAASQFFWLWCLPVVLIFAWFFGRRAKKKIASALGDRLSPFLTRSVSAKKRTWKVRLQLLVLALMIVALARPQSGESKQEIKTEGVEIIFAVDVSESMMAEDVRPSRLEQAKVDLSKLVDLMPGNKIGVMAFAGSAALLSPLTNDPAAVKMYIESLAPDSVSSQGTCFECALRVAKDSFEKGGVSTDDTTKVTRVILIASDGEDQEKDAEKAATQLVEQGVRIFTVAYGTEKGAGIPVRDNMGYLKGYKKDRSGQAILTQVKGDALRSLAQEGKGGFFFATIGGTHLSEIVDDIAKLEKTQFDSSVATQYEEKYQPFLLLAVLLAVLELFLGERVRRFQLWKGRFEVPPA